MPTLTPNQLLEISTRTIGHYNQSAASFWEGTKEHDVSQNIQALLRHIQTAAPARILDFGCGPGRDLMTLKGLGHEPVGLDGALAFCEMARQHSGCEVLHQNFLTLNLPPASFDGIFANASLFHVPISELPRVLGELHQTLVPAGVLFSSNPRGNNIEGFQGERYGSYHDYETWQYLLNTANFDKLEVYYRPEGLPRAQQPWLATVWRKRE